MSEQPLFEGQNSARANNDSLGRPWQRVKTLDVPTHNVFTTTFGYDGWSRPITTVYQRGSDAAKQFGQRD